jgi:hypothetical protein
MALIEPCVSSSTPRAVAVSGVLFASLYITSLILIRTAAPADPADPGVWLTNTAMRGWIRLALNLVPFAGLAFLWFMAVLRDRIGLQEDRLLATVFLGSGLMFVAMLFIAVSVARGMLDAFGIDGRLPSDSDAYRVARGTAYALMQTFGLRMAAVFMFVTSSIGLRTAVFSRWISYLGFGGGLCLVLIVAEFAWLALVIPVWVLTISVYLLAAAPKPIIAASR